MTNNISLDVYDISDVPPHMTTQWRELGARSVQKNVYLSPEFSLSASRLAPSQPVKLMTASRSGRLVGATVYVELPPPLFRTCALYRPTHGYMSGFLLDPEAPAEVLRAMLTCFTDGTLGTRVLRVQDFSLRSPMKEILFDALSASHITWHEIHSSQRAVVDFRQPSGGQLLQNMSKRRQKDLRRKARRLEDLGPVEWRIIAGADLVAARTFLELEHRSWKGERGSSLLSTSESTSFFLEWVQSAGDAIFFSELLVGGKVISSTANLKEGDTAFAFKSAYDPDYAKYSPGVQNEVRLLEYLERHDEIAFADSGADTGSYMEELWPHSSSMYQGAFTCGPVATGTMALVNTLRQAKRRGVSWIRQRR